MGLAEKRALSTFQESQFKEWEKKIHAAAGFAVPIEVKWDQLAAADYGHMYDTAWPKVYFEPLIDTFKEIAVDEMGRKALQAGIKKIVIGHSGASFDNIHFESGVIHMDHDPVSNIDYVQDRVKKLVSLLEKEL